MGRVLSLIGERDLAGLRAELALLTDGQRRDAAAAVEVWSRNLRAEQAPLQGGRRWGQITWPLACAAVVGTFSAPAAAATALLRVDRQCRAFFVPADLMVAMARERGLTWLPDLAGRLRHVMVRVFGELRRRHASPRLAGRRRVLPLRARVHTHRSSGRSLKISHGSWIVVLRDGGYIGDLWSCPR